jgi:hypothetical protein
MAHVRAPTMAAVTQLIVHHPGQPPAARFQRRLTRSRTSSVITISSGHAWATSSIGPFSVASTPSLPPKRWRSAA